MAIPKEAEKLIEQVANGEGAKYGRDSYKYAVDAWHMHTGKIPKKDWPKGWKDPYAKLDKAAKAKAKK